MGKEMASNGTKLILEGRKALFIETALELGFEAKVIDVCEKSGVPKRTFYNWLDDDEMFKDVWENLWKREMLVGWSDTAKSIMKSARRGDMSAAKLHAQLCGHLVEKQQIDVTETIKVMDLLDDET